MPDALRPRLLVTGGNGFLGQVMTRRLQALGHPVRATLREAGWSQDGIETTVVGDLSGATDWSAALADVGCVIHVAGRAHQLARDAAADEAAFQRVNVDATLALARQASRAGVRRLIFISSIGVNGDQTHERAFGPDDVPRPAGPYAQSKLDAEIGLAAISEETGLDVVIIRPPLITGAGAKGNLQALYGAIRRGLPLPFAMITNNRRDFVSRETLCDLVSRCIDHPAAAGQRFLVSDGGALSTRALIEGMAAEIGVAPRLVPVPPSLLRGLLSAAGRARMAAQLTQNLEVDISSTCDRLGWKPPGRTGTGAAH